METAPIEVLCGHPMLGDAVARSLSDAGTSAVARALEDASFTAPVLAVFTGGPEDGPVLSGLRAWDPEHHAPCRAWVSSRDRWSFIERVLADHGIGVVTASSIGELAQALACDPEPPMGLPRPLTNGLLNALCQLAGQPDSRALLARGLLLSPSTVDEQLRRVRDRLLEEGAIDRSELPDGYLSTERLIGWAREHRYDLGLGMAEVRREWVRPSRASVRSAQHRLPSGTRSADGLGVARRLAG